MWPNPQKTANLITFIEEILNPIQDGPFEAAHGWGAGIKKTPS